MIIKLSKRQRLRIIPVYAPTFRHPEEEVDAMYEEINDILNQDKTQHTINMGNFNAKVGLKAHNQKRTMGNFGIGHRNEKGDRLIEITETRHFKIMNTFLKKKPTRK